MIQNILTYLFYRKPVCCLDADHLRMERSAIARSRVVALTCTRDRPVPLSVCDEYVRRQTRKVDKWVIVTDGTHTGTAVPDVLIHRPLSKSKENTLIDNLREGLQHVRNGDVLFFIEDDDWYSPIYVETVMDFFADTGAYIAGNFNSLYYRVDTRTYRWMENRRHASLCCTAIRINDETLADIHRALDGDCSFDVRLWRSARSKKAGFLSPTLCVGIKGMPGTRGTTSGWSGDQKGYTNDPDLSYLTSVIGRDVRFYRQYGGVK